MRGICIFIVICLSASSYGQKFIYNLNDTTVFTEYLDGKQWAYRNTGDFIVGMTNTEVKDDYGRYYQIAIVIKNLCDSSTTFYPEDVTSFLIKNNGDTLALNVYTDEEYQKKIKNTQMWAMILYGFSAGLNSANAGYSTSYSTTYGANGTFYVTSTTHYDAVAAAQANAAMNEQIFTLSSLFENERLLKRQGYLKITTIYPNEVITGYMNIKRKKGDFMTVNIKVGGQIYSFDWDVKKKKDK